ncbi:MAG TPA: 50S ribosomal protein L6 [bacterium]|nr:MAG: 50S ribosomal protein L6 [Parcubacteria group bacterium ADurb.Bin115]HNU81123.1 50S ribosomal protein L6 [bacterium]HPY99791.1 50S ribosomal protein L6 [bacterium]HQB76001.1 50S ribosomal protein L6 [bacterium]
MSRLGKLPIKLLEGVSAQFNNGVLTVKGPKGELSRALKTPVTVEIDEAAIRIVVTQNTKDASAYWGLYRALVNNMVTGVKVGFTKKLEINGVGYRVAVNGSKLNLNLGYSHPIEFPLPAGISATVEANVITLSGIDNELLGNTAFKIRKLRVPEPYKGKGVKYVDEVLRRKAGKTAAKK